MQPYAALLLVCLAAPDPDQPGPLTVTATDRSCRVTFPAGWREKPEEGWIVSATMTVDGPLFGVFRDDKADLSDKMTLARYAQQYVDGALASPDVEEAKTTRGPTKCTVDSRPALQYELTKVQKASGTKGRWFITVVDGHKSYFVLAASYRPSEEDQCKPAIEKAVKSFVDCQK
jgi:hypothetical protein